MTPKTETPVAAATQHPQVGEAEAIVREIVAVMTLRLADLDKVFADEALNKWREQLLDGVKQQLKSGNWKKDRPTVLAVARDMASIAAMLAHKDDKVDKTRLETAFEAVKFHRRCPPRGTSPSILGCWCP